MNYYKKNPLIKKSIGLVKNAFSNAFFMNLSSSNKKIEDDICFPLFFIDTKSNLKKNNILLACSGGVDSLALAYILKFVSFKKNNENSKIADGFNKVDLISEIENTTQHYENINIYIAIIDHGIQDNSDKVCENAKKELMKIGYSKEQIFIEKIRKEETRFQNKNFSSEDNLRYLRYKELEKIANKCQAKYVLTAHTLDDVAENIFLGLARGSGAKSLNGISEQNGRILRPFLKLTRKETIKICEFADLDFWEDPTNGQENNTDERFPLRSRIRNEIMPVLKNVLGDSINISLARTAFLLQKDDAYFDRVVDDFIYNNALDKNGEPIFSIHKRSDSFKNQDGNEASSEKIAVKTDFEDVNQVAIEISKIEALDFSIRTRVIKRIIELIIGRQKRGISMKHIFAIDSLLTDWHGQKNIFIPSLSIYRIKERLLIFDKLLG